MASLTAIHTYPVKSCGGLSHERIAVDPRGLRGDRRYLVIDANGRFMTGRQHPALVRVAPKAIDDGLRLTAPGMAPLHIDQPDADGTVVDVRIWRDDVAARALAPEADAWISDYLGTPCRLVYQHEQDTRPISDPTYPPGASLPVSFADGYPLLLIGRGSLAALNERLKTPVQMARFRPNLIVDSDEPFIEDGWTQVSIGDVTFDVAKRCARCVFTTVDPVSGEVDPDGEPLRTLRGFRLDKAERGVMFGVNLVPHAVENRRSFVEVGQSVIP